MKKIAFIAFFIAFIVACSTNDNKSSDTGNGDGFDRKTMLTNWADNIIVPSYVNYQSKVQDLVVKVNAFNDQPDEVNLQLVRNSWMEAYKAYQYVAIYTFGKAQEIYLKECTNAYPTDKVGIDSNIDSNVYDLTKISQFPRQGFPALDYMINGLASDDAGIVSFYTTNVKADNYKKYLADLSLRLKTNADLIANDWSSGYRDKYVNSDGNSVSSSVNMTTNCFVKNFEKDVRAGKVGIPAGVFSNGTLPESVEAYYKKDLSKELLNVGVKASQDFFNGKHFNGAETGESLKTYLDYIKAVREGKNLSDIINAQYQTIFTTNEALSNNLSEQVINDNSKMMDSYNAMQELVVYIKLDMMQALNIVIDYNDTDGD